MRDRQGGTDGLPPFQDAGAEGGADHAGPVAPAVAAQAEDRLPRVGRRIRQYELNAELGRGGMGVVYRAHDHSLKREAALKTLLPELASDEHARRRFVREARAASRLAHPNIVPVFEAFEEDGFPWLVMPFVAGPSLRDVLDGGERLETERVVRLGEDLASALQAAHQQGIVHRDLKPGNVLLSDEGRALLVDFGLARFVAASDGAEKSLFSTLTGAGSAVGTPAFMSPEQILGQELDGRSDLFSLGALLYQAASGRSPFASGALAHVFGAILHREPEPLTQLVPDAPEELDRILRKALAKRPDERYQSAAEMVTDLRALRRRQESGSGQAPTAVVPLRRRWPLAATAGALLVLAAVAALAVVRARRPEPFSAGVPRRLTGATGWEAAPAMSPDGTTVAYVSDQAGNPDVWVVDARGGRPLQITDDPGDDSEPTWFPDSSAIAFASDRGGARAIWSVGRLGGEPVLVVANATSPAISPDGRRVAFCRPDGGDPRIFVAPLDDPEAAVRLTGPEHGRWAHTHPAWSPDGSELCYADASSLWRVEVDGGRVHRLTDGGFDDDQPVYSADGRSLLFSSERQGTRAIWQVDRRGGEPRRITLGTGPESAPSVSRDGSLLAYTTYHRQEDIVVLNLERGERWRFGDLSTDAQPALVPDGSAVIFMSDRWDSRFELWLQPLADGQPTGSPRRLTDQPGAKNLPVLSPDGRWVAYHSNLEGRRNVEIVSVAGGRPIPFTTDEGAAVNPDWSPDGAQLVYAADRDGSSHLFVAGVHDGRRRPGPPTQLTEDAASDVLPRWSPNGRDIAFVRIGERGSDAWVVAASGGPPRQLTSGADVRLLAWDRRRRSLLVSGGWGQAAPSLRSVDPSDGAVTDTGLVGQPATVDLFSQSGDGRLLAVEQQVVQGDIWVLAARPRTY